MYQKEHQMKHKKKEQKGKWTKHSAHPKKDDSKTWKTHTHLKFRYVSVKITINDFCVKQKIIPSCNKLLLITKGKTCFPWEKEYLRIRNSVVGAVTVTDWETIWSAVRNSVVGTVTVTDWTTWGSEPVTGKRFSSPKAQTHSGAHPTSNSVGTGVFSSGLE